MKRYLIALILLCLTLTPALAEPSYEVIYPSPAERTIIAGRDFYVIATVPAVAREGMVRLIDENGAAARTIIGTDEPIFFTEYDSLSAFNADSDEYLMPDLIYDPGAPESLWDGSIKCYIKDGLLLAIVPGGYYQMDGRAIADGEGRPYAILTEGEYTLEVEAGGANISVPLTLGVTEDKVMSRFTPDGHLANVASVAEQSGARTYMDPLPGYWSPSNAIPGQEDNPYFAEIQERWQLADAMEYMSGKVHFYIYNVSPGSATNTVELAALQLDGALDTRMLAYHYDIGEPLLPYTDGQSEVYLLGTFVPFAKGDRLALTRAEVTQSAQDNFYIAYEGEPRPIDIDVYDGLSVPAGESLTIFGVFCPIQNAMEDLRQISPNKWETGNRITQIEYAFACEDQSWTERRDTGLTRMLAQDWESSSLYEFAHSFIFDEALAGKTLSVTVMGYDSHGFAVEGTAETFEIAVG